MEKVADSPRTVMQNFDDVFGDDEAFEQTFEVPVKWDVLMIFQWFGWGRAAIYSGPSVYCDYGAISIDHELIRHGLWVTEWVQHLHGEDEDLPRTEVEVYLRGFKDSTRSKFTDIHFRHGHSMAIF